MKIIVHRGTHQIGGCVTEIQSNSGTRIIIDIGENLPSSNVDKNCDFKLDGLTQKPAKFDAVFITHYHGDHIGLYNKILPEIPIYVGKVSKEIYKILQTRLSKSHIISEDDLNLIDNFKTYCIPYKKTIKDIVITPIAVDHSAFDAHMFLIECDGKRVLHTGDFRTHGQRGSKVFEAIEKYVGKVDCLICEGTTLSRNTEYFMTEHQLQQEAKKLFDEHKQVFVMCSSTNIDRIAALHKAALASNRLFVCDNYQKELLLYIDSISRSPLYKFKDRVLSYGKNIYDLMQEKGFVMLVRANTFSKKIMKKFPESKFIYSQWEGYLKKDFPEYEYLQKMVPEDYIYLHTSGHADFNSLKQVAQIVDPNILVPIHCEDPSNFEKLDLKNCKIKLAVDGEEINI